jgi:murein DD-endopeptidase MepM/ murein hydrolase activator NlpD
MPNGPTATRSSVTEWTLVVGLLALTFSGSGYGARRPSERPTRPAVALDVQSPDVDRAAEPAAEDEAGPAIAAPLGDEYRLTSGYGWRPSRRTGARTFHAGLDFGAPRGTPVQAVVGATVAIVARDADRQNGMSGYGNAVVLYVESEDLWILYGHLNEVRVEQGARVEAGQTIGTVGNTSNRSFRGMAAHLHFELRGRTAAGDAPFPGPYGISRVNPRQWLEGHGVVYSRQGTLVAAGPATAGLDADTSSTAPELAAATPRGGQIALATDIRRGPRE